VKIRAKAPTATTAGGAGTTRARTLSGLACYRTRVGGVLPRLGLALLGTVLAALFLAGPASAAPVELPSQTFDGHETAAGSFAGIPQVAVDEATGDVFVLDSKNNSSGESHDVVDRFHFDGTAWKPVAEIKGSETTAGTFGLNGLREASLEIDPATGHLYVASVSRTVFAFEPSSSSPSGYQEIWEKAPFGSSSSLNSIALDPEGHPWAVSETGGKIERLSAATGEPTAELSIAQPRRIAFDSTGTLYVLSTESLFHGIDKYVGGTYKETFDAGSANTDLATEAGTGNLFSGGLALKEWDSSGNKLVEVGRVGGGIYWSFAVDTVHHRLFVGESTPEGESPAVRVYELQPDLTLNVTGQGSVECEVEGGGLETCAPSYLQRVVLRTSYMRRDTRDQIPEI